MRRAEKDAVEQKASEAVKAAKESFDQALTNFMTTYEQVKDDNNAIVLLTLKIAKAHASFITTLNKAISDIHNAADFYNEPSWVEDWLITIGNIIATSFNYLTLLEGIAKKHGLPNNTPNGNSYRRLQSFLGTFADNETIQRSLTLFKNKRMLTVGFGEKFPPKAGPFSWYTLKQFLMMNLFKIIAEALKAVPFVKYAVGILGIAAVIAVIKGFDIGYRVGVWGTIIMLALMTVLYLLARLSAKNNYSGPSAVLTYGMACLFIIVCILIVSCTFFRWPQPINNVFASGDNLKSDTTKPSLVKDSLPPPPVAKTSTLIEGHIYKPDMSPVKGMNVIISVNGFNPQISNDNGGFSFDIPNDKLPDTLLINVWSKTTGFKNKKFPRSAYTKPCDIILNKQTQIAINSSKLNGRKLCTSLISPLQQYLRESADLYADYVKDHSYKNATLIYNLDKKMYELIKVNTPLIPDSLGMDIGLLIQHFSIWTKAYENKVASAPREPNSEFRIQYDGNKFPEVSANRVLAIADCK